MKIEGRQKLSANDIERKSDQLLSYYKKDFLDYVQPTPLKKIANFLNDKHGIEFDFKSYLGFSEDGLRILGAFNPFKKMILVDASLEQYEEKFNFTLAHELGHLALHRNLSINYEIEDESELTETISEIGFENRNLKSEIEWVEWQANAYASSLLMPSLIFQSALIQTQKNMGIGRWGKLFVDNQPINQADFIEVISRLGNYFKVSKTAVEYRLRKLNLIDDHRRGLRFLRNYLDNR